jgi:hypothetical protein
MLRLVPMAPILLSLVLVALASGLGSAQLVPEGELVALATGVMLVVAGVLLAAYAVTASLRFVTLPRTVATRPESRRWALKLVLLDGAATAGLAVESLRLGDAFWWYCSLGTGLLALLVLLRLAPIPSARALALSRGPDWETWQRQNLSGASWPEIAVTSTVAGSAALIAAGSAALIATRGPARASVSVDMGSL